MRAEDLDHDEDQDDLDDTSCTQQRPKRRHCWQWFLVGEYVVIGCAHCPKVRRSWLAVSGDSERVSESDRNHEQRCARLIPWRWVPAQRTPSTAPVSATSATRPASKSGR
jgi:hypothetical protein